MKLYPLMMVAGIAVGATTAASADPVTFTWSPSGASPSLNGGDVKANDITVADFASAKIDPTTNNFVETGALLVTNFSQSGIPVTTPTLNQPGGYSLYLTFTASGNQGGSIPLPGSGGSIKGTISNITYTLWGLAGGAPTFTVSNGNVAITNNAGAFALASGSGGGTSSDFVTLTNAGGTNYIPGAQAVTSFNPAAGEDGFFVVPPVPFVLDLEAAFINTEGVAKINFNVGGFDYLNITGGGGNLDLASVPEPATLAVLGVGLLGLGLVRRKQK